LPEYLTSFISSKLGFLHIQEALLEANNEEKWKNISIFLPGIEDQKILVSSINKLDNLNSNLSSLSKKIITNPQKAKDIEGNLIEWITRLDMLSLDEKIVNLVDQGETDKIEFKETLSLDVKKNTKEKYIELSSLKTIAGFLNSRGGVLLVGVRDNGEQSGIQEEVDKFYKGANDNFLKHFKNILKTSIGEEFYPYISYEIVSVNGINIFYVACKQSTEPCYLNGQDFYVRTNPATDKLEGPKLVSYVQNHFIL
jgi:hypothetical protein